MARHSCIYLLITLALFTKFMSSQIELKAAFGALLKAAKTTLDKSYWFDIFDLDEKSPNDFTVMSLTNLNKVEYVNLLTISGLASSVGHERRPLKNSINHISISSNNQPQKKESPREGESERERALRSRRDI